MKHTWRICNMIKGITIGLNNRYVQFQKRWCFQSRNLKLIIGNFLCKAASTQLVNSELLTHAGLRDNPGQSEEQHDSPDVEEVANQHAFDPSELDGPLAVRGQLRCSVHPYHRRILYTTKQTLLDLLSWDVLLSVAKRVQLVVFTHLTYASSY